MNIVAPYATSSYVLLRPATLYHAQVRSVAFVQCTVTLMHASDWLEFSSNQTHLGKLGLKCNTNVILGIVQRGTTWHNITQRVAQRDTTWHNVVQRDTIWHNVTQYSTTCQVAVDCTFSPKNVALNVGIRNVAQHHGQNVTL